MTPARTVVPGTTAADSPRRPTGSRRLTGLALAVALAAGGALVARGPGGEEVTREPPGRVTAATAWPAARRADIEPGLPDGPLFTPAQFLDATTAIGTAPTPSGAGLRLLVRTGTGKPRELRRVSLENNPRFEGFAAAGDDIVWAESDDARPGLRLWTARRTGGAPRLLTADTGDAVFTGSQYDLVVANGLVHWAAAPPGGQRERATEIRSVPLAGGPVTVRTEPGQWTQSAWPWLADDVEHRLRNTATARDTAVALPSGVGEVTCSQAWCRVMVLGGGGLAGIDVMRPDGSARRRIAGPGAQVAVADVAVLDRFEILAEPGPDSDLTGTAALLVHDIATGRTVLVAPATDGAISRGGVLWWSTGDQDSLAWHTLDLRTV